MHNRMGIACQLVGCSYYYRCAGPLAIPQSAQSTVTIPFTAAQTTGDLNAVVVEWSDSTATITSVTGASI